MANINLKKNEGAKPAEQLIQELNDIKDLWQEDQDSRTHKYAAADAAADIRKAVKGTTIEAEANHILNGGGSFLESVKRIIALLNKSEDNDDTHLVDLGLDSKFKDMIDSVFGQMSDGYWENTPRMRGYWKFAHPILKDNKIYLEIENIYTKHDANSVVRNLWDGMSDARVKQFLADKIKFLVKEEGLKWDRGNTNTTDYLSYSNPYPVKDCYYAYEVLKGRNVGKHPEYSEAYVGIKDGTEFPVNVEYIDVDDDWQGNSSPDIYKVTVNGESGETDAIDDEKECVGKVLKALGYSLKLIKKNNEEMTPQLQKLLEEFSGEYEETFEKGRFRLKAYTRAHMSGPYPYCYLIVTEYALIGNKWVTSQDFIPHSTDADAGVRYMFLEKNSTAAVSYDSIVFPGKFGDEIAEAANAIVRAFRFTIARAAKSGMDNAECEKCANDLTKNTAFIEQVFSRMEKHLPGLYTSVEAIYAAAKNAAAATTTNTPASAEIKSGPHKGDLLYTPAAKTVAKKIGEDLLMAILAAASDKAWGQADESEWKDAVDTDHSLEWNTCKALGWGFDDMGADTPFKGDSGKSYSGKEARNAYDAIAELSDDDRYSLFFNNQPRNYSHIRDVVATSMDMAASDEAKKSEAAGRLTSWFRLKDIPEELADTYFNLFDDHFQMAECEYDWSDNSRGDDLIITVYDERVRPEDLKWLDRKFEEELKDFSINIGG